MAMDDGNRDRPRGSRHREDHAQLSVTSTSGASDLLVRDGFYSNRTDLMRTAIRNLLDRHDDAVRTSVARDRLELGLRHYGRVELEAARHAARAHRHPGGRPGEHRARRLARTRARAAIASVRVLGTLQASPDVRTALRDRMV